MLAEPDTPITRNECMIPQTVPNNPIKGATEAVVASQLILRSSLVSWTEEARESAR